MASTESPLTDVAALRAMHGGEVITPSDSGYDAARQAFNLVIDQRPAAIALPESADDVAAVVRYARAAGLRIAPQATGHNAGPLGDLRDTILLKTSRMRGATIDVGARRARANAGAQWADVTGQASERGLAPLHGSAPDVGIVGYSLGGGIGFYARKLGLQANSVTAIELVTAEGEQIRVDHDNEAELFWALRGGGGNFGLVTAIEFALYPLERVYAGALFYPLERASEVLHTWHELTAAAPDELTSIGRVMQFPPFPEIPEPLRGNSFALVEAAYIGDEADGAELLRPLRELGPAMDTVAVVPPVALSELHMDPPEPVPALTGTTLVGELPSAAIDDFLAVTGSESGSPLVSVELRHLGGALARSDASHGAADTMPGEYLMFAVGIPADEQVAAAVGAQIGKVKEALSPHRTGDYASFVEEEVDTGSLYPDEAYARLRAVKAAVDPGGLFRANHEIAPA